MTAPRLQPPDDHLAMSLVPAGSATVFVVDDDGSFLTSIGRLLRASGHQVKMFTSAEDFLAQLTLSQPGCVLMDLDMPGMGGLELQAVLARTGNPLPVVFLTGQGDIRSSVWAMRQGAADFLTKLASREELLAAVQSALARDLRERQARLQQSALRARFDGLTVREMEVLALVVQGKLNKEIAADLGIHERTVKLHRTAVTTKLGVPSVAELTKLWIEAGLATGK